jgi:phosphopantothenoylcysteine decarboxylase/phosphopantothenate--cysteine ligase
MNILVTAGATWIKVDEVRILTTLFTGNTGLFIAQELAKKGHKVTLLVNPHCFSGSIKAKGCKIVTFHYFDELRVAVERELKAEKYGAIIHSAAVSDYKVDNVYKGKIPSSEKDLILRLSPAQKIIKSMRKSAPQAYLVQFKLEIEKKGLLEKAQNSMYENNSNAVVANAYEDLKAGYRAYLISTTCPISELNSKNELVEKINQLIKTKKGLIFGFGEKS